MKDSTTIVPRRDCSLAIGNAARTSSSLCRSRQTPRPWLPSSVAVERLEDDREADPVGDPDRLILRAHGLLLGDRQSGRAEEPGREVLVGGDVDGDRRGRRGHRGPDPLGVDALAELHEGVLVEPDPRDVAGHRLVEDRLGRGAEGGALGAQDEGLELLVPVELGVRLDEVVDQAYGELGGGPASLAAARPTCSSW